MSTILDALKKAEQESAGRLPAPSSGRPVRSRYRRGLVGGMVVLGVAVGLWVGYLATGLSPVTRGGGRRKAAEGESSSKEVAVVPPAVLPPLPAPPVRQDRELRAVKSDTASGEVKASLPELKLSGVVYDPANPMAIINGRFVGVGDSISGAKILRIERNCVAISFEGSERTINLSR